MSNPSIFLFFTFVIFPALCVSRVFVCVDGESSYVFRFATIFGDHMVLQQAPHEAVIWGYSPDCLNVTVTFNSAKTDATIVHCKCTIVCVWST